MKRAFLYIDILGFENLVRTNPEKVDQIFKIFNDLKVHRHFALQTIVFSDTILVFNKDESRPIHYYCTYLVEYAQQLFYHLVQVNVYFKAILTFGDFNYSQLRNIEAYYGLTLIDAYHDEVGLEGFGLYVDKVIADEVIIFDKVPFNEKYEYVLLCQSMVNLYKYTKGVLPLDPNIFTETDTYFRIDEDLRFFREIEFLMNKCPVGKAKIKYKKVYDIYKKQLPLFFETFEKEGFLPFVFSDTYIGSINPFIIIAERELKGSDGYDEQ
jgi:hypothetical protein